MFVSDDESTMDVVNPGFIDNDVTDDDDDVILSDEDDDSISAADYVTYYEVTLRRRNTDDRLGLTLHYRDAHNGTSDVIVGEIDPTGEAAKLGCIQEGDQIIQINGVDVRSRDQVLRLFGENALSVMVLLARHHVASLPSTQMTVYDDFSDRSVIDIQPSLSRHLRHQTTFMSAVRTLECIDEEEDMTDSCSVVGGRRELEVDSGISRTDDSLRNDESSEQEMIDTDSASPSNNDSPPRKSSSGSQLLTTSAPTDTKLPGISTELFADVCCSRRDRDVTAVDCRPPLPPPRRPPAPHRSLDKLSPPPPPAETATASIEDVIGRLRLDDARKMVDCGVRRVPRMGTRLCGDNTSSRLPGVSDPPPESLPTRLRPPDDDNGLVVPSHPAAGSPLSPVNGASGVSRSTQTDSDGGPETYRVCADVMYTNRANLRYTIAVQQRLFRQQLADRQVTSPPQSLDTRPRPDLHDGAPRPGGAKLEWIVRKRSDGSRYVTRRPVRSRGERVHRTTTWVGDITTTDDDDIEQPKTGRYWTRDERRQHVAERRQRDAMKQMKREAARQCNRAQHGLAAELAVISRHRQTALLSVATV